MTTTKPLTKYARYVTEAVCARRQVPIEAVMGRNRNKWVSWARFEIWSILVRTPDMPLLSTYAAKNVGRMFGRDHSSVMNGVRRFRGLEMIPSKRDRRPRLPDPDPPPPGCCLPLTPRKPPPMPELKPAAHIHTIPRPIRVFMTKEEARAFRAKCERERRRRRRPIGADDGFWLRSLRDGRARASDEHV